jgi:hypothetical protein
MSIDLKETIYDLVKTNKLNNIDSLVSYCHSHYKASERQVKEAIWELLQEQEIAPDKYWNLTKKFINK